MIPNMSLSASSSANATGGTQGVTNNALKEGDWIISQGAGDAGTNKTVMYMAVAGAVLWLMKRRP